MEFIQPWLNGKLEGGLSQQEAESLLGVGRSMVTAYKKGDYNPSLAVAITVYKGEGVVLHPFSEDSLKFEIKKDA